MKDVIYEPESGKKPRRRKKWSLSDKDKENSGHPGGILDPNNQKELIDDFYEVADTSGKTFDQNSLKEKKFLNKLLKENDFLVDLGRITEKLFTNSKFGRIQGEQVTNYYFIYVKNISSVELAKLTVPKPLSEDKGRNSYKKDAQRAIQVIKLNPEYFNLFILTGAEYYPSENTDKYEFGYMVPLFVPEPNSRYLAPQRMNAKKKIHLVSVNYQNNNELSCSKVVSTEKELIPRIIEKVTGLESY